MEVTRTLSARISRSLALLFTVLAAAVAVPAQTIPLAIVSSTQVLVPAINSNAGHIAANTAGDVFYVSQGDNIAYWLPRGKTTPIALVTGLSGGRSVYVDSKNNVYVPSNYSGNIIEVPYANGTYATGVASGTTSACTSITPTSPCNQFGSGAAVTSYYYQPTDLGFDAAGNAYVVDEYNQNGPGGANKNNGILKWTPNGTGYAASYLVQTLPQNNSAQIAVDPLGDVYYADGSGVYSIPAGAKTATPITNAAITDPTGVATDQFGDLFITNSNVPYAILEQPAVNGVAVAAKQFTFSQGYSGNGIAFDGLGDYFFTAYNNATNINEASLYAINVGTAAVGKPSAAAATTISVLFTGNAAPATITSTGTAQGFTYVPGSCAAGVTYNSGSSCNVNVTFTPTAPGLQTGSVILADAKGNSLVTISLSGTGLGAQVTSDPGTITAIGSGLKTPQAIAVDTANNVYVADPAQNAVLRYAPGSTTSTPVGTGLLKPAGVAVDGAGNVYIADSGNGRIVLVPSQNGTLNSAAQSVLLTSYTIPAALSGTGATTTPAATVNLGSTLALALDGNSNLYVADLSHAQVLRLANIDGFPSAAALTLVSVTGLKNTGDVIATNLLVAPSALATDASGDLFIADTTSNTLYEVQNYGKALGTIGSGYSHIAGLATDAAGSLYVADTGNNRLLKIPFEAPIYNTNDQYGVGSTILSPFGVALDGAANLYVVDSTNAAAFVLNRAQGTLPIGRTNINTTSPTLNGYIGNSGNQPFKFGSPAYVATGNTTVFTVMSPSSNGCTANQTIAAGFACVLNGSFMPTTTGNYAETLSFTSNAGFPAAPSLTLTGLALNLAPTTLTLAQTSPAGTAAFGQSIVVTATIASMKAGTPTGTLTVFVDGGSPISVAVNGTTASVTLTGLTGGMHTIAASYTGDNNFAPSNNTLTVTVAKTTTATSVTAGGSAAVFQNPVSAQAGTPIPFTAVVVQNGTTVPTGTVTFTAGGVVLGTSPLNNKSVPYQAMLTSALLPAGSSTVIATYNGDVNYLPSSGSIAVLISPQLFTVTPPVTGITMGTAASSTFLLQVSSISGYNGYVGLVCSGLPANTGCGFSPNGLILQASNLLTAAVTDPKTGAVLVPATYGATPVVVTLNTGTTPPVPQPVIKAFNVPFTSRSVPVSWAFLGLAPLTLLFGRKSLRRLRSVRLLTVLIVMLGSSLFFSGCGSGLIGVTPTGTYAVTITATSTATTYTGPLAPGCVVGAAVGTTAAPTTCTQVVTLNLTVQ